MHTRLFLRNLLILSIIFLVLPYVANSATQSSVAVDLAPASPAPFENATIILSSYSNNLDSVLITWSVNGKTSISEVGKKSFSFQAGAAGVTTTVVAKIDFPEGALEKRISIKPAVMVLLWEAYDSYVPPFYKGKAMPILDSEIKMVAMPEARDNAGTPVNPKNMSYDWKIDYSNDTAGSGYGKNYYIYKNDYLEGINTVGVTAYTGDGSSSSEANISVGTVEPKIVFYKNDKTLGNIWENALTNPHTIKDTEILVAIPYFMSPKLLQAPNLVYNWSINGSSVSVIGPKNIMPLQVQEGTSGKSNIELTVENKFRIFQTSSAEINIEF